MEQGFETSQHGDHPSVINNLSPGATVCDDILWASHSPLTSCDLHLELLHPSFIHCGLFIELEPVSSANNCSSTEHADTFSGPLAQLLTRSTKFVPNSTAGSCAAVEALQRQLVLWAPDLKGVWADSSR
jgi:hypothetical protein